MESTSLCAILLKNFFPKRKTSRKVFPLLWLLQRSEMALQKPNKFMCFPFPWPSRGCGLSEMKMLNYIFKGSFRRKLPCFNIDPKHVEVLHEPAQFYDKLLELTSRSKHRIVLSSLYIGTGKLEKKLMLHLKSHLEHEPNVNLTVLIDYMRGNRLNDTKDAESSSRSLLLPLVTSGANVSFFLSPLFSKWWTKRFLFQRQPFNEIISLQHIKCYIFDDSVIVSGANLSDNYFTHRQDRYICFHNCKELCDYLEDLIKTISSFSLQLTKSNTLELDTSWSYHPLNASTYTKFLTAAKERVSALQDKHSSDPATESTALIVPLLQMGIFDVREEENFMSEVLKSEFTWGKLATGYFNLTNSNMKTILTRVNQKPLDILMASELANGFYGGKGLKKNIPQVYTHIAKTFLRKIEASKASVKLWSYEKLNWTFHAKGLWLFYNPNIMLSTVGSTNFNYRSVNRDLECQVVLLTSDVDLQRRLSSEIKNLWSFSQPIESVKHLPQVPLWVRLASVLLKTFF